MTIKNNYSLKSENTFHLDVKARYFVRINSKEDLIEIINNPTMKNVDKLILGDGANILFTGDYKGLVIKDEIKGIKIINEDKQSVFIEVGGGENWHGLVTYAVDNNFGGIENLAYIPGTVGAAPAQNLAAYGQNMSDVFSSLIAVDLETCYLKSFNKSECDFKYRDSFFKSKKGRRYFITSVVFKLSKNPVFNTSYFETGNTYTKKNSLLNELRLVSSPPYKLKDIYNAVINIRRNKLPEVSEFGTAGSFFKNPVVTKSKYKQLLKIDKDLQCYPVNKLTYPKLDDPTLALGDYVKIPGGRLLDNLGWKGVKIGNVGTYKNQAMAIINYGRANPRELVNLYLKMQKDVFDHYGIMMEPEVNII